MSFDLPDDIVYEIAACLESADILSLCLTCRSVHNILLSALYTHVTLSGAYNCKTTLKKLVSQSDDDFDCRKHIRYLRVQPRNPSVDTRPHLPDEEAIVESIFILIMDDKMSGLKGFEWNGVEAPDEKLWVGLKKWCPGLRHVGTTVGIHTYILDPESKLFSFRDLLGFELRAQQVKSWIKSANSLIGGDRRYHPLSARLLSMLIEHSPNLTHLIIDGSSQRSQLWDLRPLIKQGRFPNLRQLCISGLGETKGPLQNVEDSILFDEFLAHHSNTLESISFTGAGYHSHLANQQLPGEGDGNFPRLRTFRGRAQQLRDPFHVSNLQSVVLLDYYSPKANLAWLSKFGNLQRLGISVNLADQGTLGKLLEVMLNACTSLKHLEIFVSSSVNITDLAFQLKAYPNLRSFSLIRPRKQELKDTLSAKAIKAAEQCNSLLEYFTVREVAIGTHENWLLENFKTKGVVNCRFGGVSPNGKRILWLHWKSGKVSKVSPKEITFGS